MKIYIFAAIVLAATLVSANRNDWEWQNPSDDEFTDVLPFRWKISQRIENSNQLSNRPVLKNQIMRMVDEKLRVCKTPGAAKGKVMKSCAGRMTGQIMQMIASYENEDGGKTYNL